MEPNGRVGKDSGQFQAQPSIREKPSHAKTARILDACRWKDTKLLRALATTQGGLISDAVRRQAWPLLLGYPTPESIWNADEELEDWRTLPKHRDEGQVRLDVDRSFIYYPNNQSPKDLEGKKQELSDLITEVLRRQPYLCYFQGYHDICQVFLLVLDQSSRAAAVARLSTLRIRDFMLPKLRPALDQLNLIPAIIQASNIQLYNHLFGNVVGMEPFFALSGTLTMYAHDIQEYGEISRLFDVFLAREAVFSVYMFAQVVLQRSEELFEIPSDEPEMMHSILSKLPKPLNLEALISNSVKLFEKYPPENLPTWSRISKASVLKTARWPDQIERQSLEDGQAYFKLQAKELQWAEKRAEALALLHKHRTPIRNIGITVLIGVLSFWVRKSSYFGSPGTFGAFGAHFQRWYYWYIGYPGH